MVWLQKHGFTIIDQNYHGPYGEIDIVTRKMESFISRSEKPDSGYL